MEGEAIATAAAALTAAMGAAGDFPLDPVCSLPIFKLGASPLGSVHDEGSEIEGCGGAGLRESSVAAHDSCGHPGGEGSRDSAPAESGESAVKPDPKAPGWIRRSVPGYGGSHKEHASRYSSSMVQVACAEEGQRKSGGSIRQEK